MRATIMVWSAVTNTTKPQSYLVNTADKRKTFERIEDNTNVQTTDQVPL